MDKPRWRGEVSLGFAALFVAFVIWLMAKQSALESDQVPVRVFVEEIPNLSVEITPPTVPVIVKFPPSQRARIVPQNFEIRIDLRETLGDDPRKWAWDGKNESVPLPPINLTLDNVHTVNLPQSIRVMELGAPSRVQAQAKLLARALPVKAATTGRPPENYEVEGEIRADPAEVYVTGPRAALARLSEPGVAEARTAPINLADRRQNFSEAVDVKIPPGLQFVDENRQVAQVFVAIREKEKQATIEGAPILFYLLNEGLKTTVTPAEAKIRIKGRISLVDQVDASMFVFSTKAFLPEEPGIYERELGVAFAEGAPKEIRDNVVIEGFTPATVTIEHKKADKK